MPQSQARKFKLGQHRRVTRPASPPKALTQAPALSSLQLWRPKLGKVVPGFQLQM
jgi:hypothetical protein